MDASCRACLEKHCKAKAQFNLFLTPFSLPWISSSPWMQWSNQCRKDQLRCLVVWALCRVEVKFIHFALSLNTRSTNFSECKQNVNPSFYFKSISHLLVMLQARTHQKIASKKFRGSDCAQSCGWLMENTQVKRGEGGCSTQVFSSFKVSCNSRVVESSQTGIFATQV